MAQGAADFDEFYASTVHRVVAQVYALSGDFAGSQTATQEAYARAWQRWSTVSGYADPAAWVRGAAWRLRSQRRRAPPDTPLAATLVRDLQRLPLDHRRAVVLHHLGRLSAVEIASELGIPPAAVRPRLGGGNGFESLSSEVYVALRVRDATAVRARGDRRRRRIMRAAVTAAFLGTLGVGAGGALAAGALGGTDVVPPSPTLACQGPFAQIPDCVRLPHEGSPGWQTERSFYQRWAIELCRPTRYATDDRRADARSVTSGDRVFQLIVYRTDATAAETMAAFRKSLERCGTAWASAPIPLGQEGLLAKRGAGGTYVLARQGNAVLLVGSTSRDNAGIREDAANWARDLCEFALACSA